MYKLYEMLLSGAELWQNDLYNFLPTYFETNGAATTTFVIAAVVALVLLAVFYGILGMFSAKLGGNRWIWAVCLVLSFGITWIVTDNTVIGDVNDLTGIFGSIDTQMSNEVLPNCGGVQEQIEEAQEVQRSFNNELTDGCDLNYTLLFWNSVFSFILFGVLSFLVKRLTKYSKNVPV